MFRFTIRELVLVTVIVAMGVGWWADRRNVARSRDYFQEAARTLHIHQEVDAEGTVSIVFPDGREYPPALPDRQSQ